MKLSGKSPFKKLIYLFNAKGLYSLLNIEGQTIFGPDDEIVKKINYNVSEEKGKFINSIKFWPEISKIKLPVIIAE